MLCPCGNSACSWLLTGLASGGALADGALSSLVVSVTWGMCRWVTLDREPSLFDNLQWEEAHSCMHILWIVVLYGELQEKVENYSLSKHPSSPSLLLSLFLSPPPQLQSYWLASLQELPWDEGEAKACNWEHWRLWRSGLDGKMTWIKYFIVFAELLSISSCIQYIVCTT